MTTTSTPAAPSAAGPPGQDCHWRQGLLLGHGPAEEVRGACAHDCRRWEVHGQQAAKWMTTSKKPRTAISFAPLAAANAAENMNITVNVSGGGYTGQAGALGAGLGRALSLFDPTLRAGQKEGGFLTRDSRMKERKKYGQRGARRRFQFSKR